MMTSTAKECSLRMAPTGNFCGVRKSRFTFFLITIIIAVSFTREVTLISRFHSCGSGVEHAITVAVDTVDFVSQNVTSVLKTRVAGDNALTSTRINANNLIPSTNEQNQLIFEEELPSRTWSPFDQKIHPFPCYPPGEDEEARLQLTTPCHEGILFQRPTKVGSTTMTNVVLRLAHNRGAEQALKARNQLKNQNSTEKERLVREWKHPPRCRHRSNHGSGIELDYGRRNRKRSVLFSMVRDPTKRLISEFFHFKVSVYQEEPTDENFQKYALQPKHSNSLIQDLTLSKKVPKQIELEWNHYTSLRRNRQTTEQMAYQRKNLDYHRVVSEILEAYDFIAITERMDESLVALKLLMGLTLKEILYVKASRSAGSFSNGPPKTRPCIYLIPPFLTQGMQDFFYKENNDTMWLEYSKGDRLLHAAVNKSLDRTIEEVFGKERFTSELVAYQNACKYATAVCTAEPGLVVGMCDETGHSVTQDPNMTTTCYIWGEGCDHKCLDERIPSKIPVSILDGTQAAFPSH